LSSPADICYNLNNDTLGVPNSGNNTVNFYNMAYILSTGLVPSVENSFIKTFANGQGAMIQWNVEGNGNATLEIYSVAGALLRCDEVQTSGKMMIGEGDMKTGIYVARIISHEKQLSEKFFVE
jgi:hypothetical protein